ncbi:MAG: hypothetical protein DHS20C11_14540 [Lysobacteraceae bacterium]|nr:MAG: hypothetical protein DHS20C11_14540 [Xanthomonadaceae bacterium]
MRGMRAPLLLILLLALPAQAVDYDIVYVRQIRNGDLVNTTWPEVFHPGRIDAGADLILRHPDGSEEVLIDCDVCSVTDPFVSFDAQWVYYSLFPDVSPGALNTQRGNLPYAGADIYRLNFSTREIQRLTFQEFTPNTGMGHWDESNPVDPPSEYNRLGYGILNLGPTPLPGGRIAFTSNRNGFVPAKPYTFPTLQLFVMDIDGSNVHAIAPMTINSALHPTILADGRIMFSSYESQGLRDQRLWGIWSIYPDGRNWAPVVSAFKSPSAFHFMTQLGDSDLVVTDYYNLNNNGFGAMYRIPVAPPPGTPPFGNAYPGDNPPIDATADGGFYWPVRMPFTPWGTTAVTPFTHANDNAAPIGDDGTTRVGKVTHPSGAPNNDLLVVWTPGPANDLNRPTTLPYYDGGIYVIENADAIWDPADMELVVNSDQYNEAWPRAVVPYSAVHGIEEPMNLPWLPNDGTAHEALPAGTPYGLIGTSSFYKRESFPGYTPSWANTFDGLDAFNTSENGQSSNWVYQGSDAGKYDDSEIWAVRLVALEANTHRSYGPNYGQQFDNFANERHRIMGEIPLRKEDGNGQPVMDSEGNPDTSFLAKIPADTPFTFQTIDRNGLMLNMAQTWHQVRPGEVRTDCGGCHAHSQQPLDFATTAAAAPDYPMLDLYNETPMVSQETDGTPSLHLAATPMVDVEFIRDIRPILTRSCVSCHSQSDPNPPGNLVLDDLTPINGLPGDYARLADDRNADFGYPPVISNGTWRQTNASRYVRKFQARRSLLVWKVFGQRLDGWDNADHPTESVLGDASTLPTGANPNEADIDFTGSIMPPPGTEPELTIDEKMMIGRWIDLGAPIDLGIYGWFADDQRPTLSVNRPSQGNAPPFDDIQFGMIDANSGLDLSTLSVTADLVVQGRPPGSELADLAVETHPGVYQIDIGGSFGPIDDGHVRMEVADLQGNFKRVDVEFSTLGSDLIFDHAFD